jgi:Asp-tRNA(Asn)/Glu-tRNA(Gln) amidotransferase A subunit family amidase
MFSLNLLTARATPSRKTTLSTHYGDVSPDGLPVGVQIVGPWPEDPTPLSLAELIEREFGGFVPPKMFDD